MHITLDEELEYYDVDRAEIERKLRDLTVAQQFCLVELIEEFWSQQ